MIEKCWLFFFIALVIRGILFIQVIGHPRVILQPDSRMYISLAKGIRQHGSLSYPGRPEHPDVERMPGYPFFLASVMFLFGGSLIAVVLIQIVMDSLSCVLIYYLGEAIWKGAGLISGLLASINVAMMTYSHFILNDSLFLFVFLVLLILMIGFLREPKWKDGVILGAGLGIAILIRPVIVYLPLF